MNKAINKPESLKIGLTRKPPQMPAAVSRSIYNILHRGPVATAAPTNGDIARRAYQIYVEKGCPQGQSEQNWQQAEQELQIQAFRNFCQSNSDMNHLLPGKQISAF